jgi:hypothetical protein
VQALSDFISFRKNPKIEEAPLHGELMLFDGAATKFFVLNQTMAFLWRHCDGTNSFSDVLERLCQDFSEVETVTAEADLRKALEDLVSLGLVVDARSLEAGSASA